MRFIEQIPATIALFVASIGFSASMDTRVTQLENQMQDVRTETALGTYGITTALDRPNINGSGVFFSLSAIYQHARVGGTEFCYTDDDPTGSINFAQFNGPLKGRVKSIKFNWDWGLKAGIGYLLEHDGWDVYLNYKWLDTGGQRSVTAGLNSSIIPLKGAASIVNGCGPFSSSNPFTFAKFAKSQFQADFNIINFELGRSYFLSQELSVRPHWGLESAWVDLKQLVRYFGGNEPLITLQNGGLGVNTVRVRDSSYFWGLGPRFGFNTRWFLGSGFNLFADASGSVLYGRFDVSHKERFSLCPTSNRIRLDANMHRFVPTAQLILGLAYQTNFNQDKNRISVRLGYEAQYFWRVNQMLKIDDFAVLKYNRYSEDASLYGVTIDATLDF